MEGLSNSKVLIITGFGWIWYRRFYRVKPHFWTWSTLDYHVMLLQMNNTLTRWCFFRYELGPGLYLGWAAGALAILGGGILCTSFKSQDLLNTVSLLPETDHRNSTQVMTFFILSLSQGSQITNYSSSQPQKIYKQAPSENSTSKAYVWASYFSFQLFVPGYMYFFSTCILEVNELSLFNWLNVHDSSVLIS